MRNAISWRAALLRKHALLALAPLLAAFAAAPTLAQQDDLDDEAVADEFAPETDADTPSTDRHGHDGHRCRTTTVARGAHSAFAPPGSLGSDLVIRDPQSWRHFWRQHTGRHGDDERPPHVNFRENVVIATIQGPQRSGGGPNITIAGVGHDGGLATILIIDDERPGPLDVITNPFHVAVVGRRCLAPGASVRFQHVRPAEESAVIQGSVFLLAPDGERPARGASVALLARDEVVRRTTTGLDGSYVFANVEPGAYALRAVRRGFAPQRAPIEARPNALISHDFFLEPATQGAVVGRVLGQTDRDELVPIGGATVRLMQEGRPAAHARTNERGMFHIGDLDPGRYHAVASADGWTEDRSAFEVAAGEVARQRFVLSPE
jgi:hypothetical protein